MAVNHRADGQRPREISRVVCTSVGNSILPLGRLSSPTPIMNSRDHIWKSESLGKQFLEGVRGAIPFGREQIELMLLILNPPGPRQRQDA